MIQSPEHSQRAAPFAIEIFAGSAGLSAALVQVGITAIPVDHEDNHFIPKVPPKLLDLSKLSGQTELWKLLSLPNLCFVHLSPPCGTAPRARERPLPAALKAKGWPEPQPLRSEEYPMGLPNLASVSPGNVARVATANKLFVLSAEICTYRRIPWTFENPRRSLFWRVPEVQALLGHQDVELGPRACSAGRKYVGYIFFQHCMHGGARDTWTRLRCYPATIFASLAFSCNNNHVHKQWGAAGPGRFYTADETEFPPLLCSRIASIVKCHTRQSTQQSPAEPMISHPVQAHSPLPATTTSTVHTASDITPFSAHPDPAQPAPTPSSRVTAPRIAAGV